MQIVDTRYHAHCSINSIQNAVRREMERGGYFDLGRAEAPVASRVKDEGLEHASSFWSYVTLFENYN